MTRLFQRLDRRLVGFLHLGACIFDIVVDDGDFELAGRVEIGGYGSVVDIRAGAVAFVVTADDVIQNRRIFDVLRHRSDLIEAGAVRRQPIAADPAVGGLHPHDAAKGCGLTNGAAGVAS